jgi:hypothetical protein
MTAKEAAQVIGTACEKSADALLVALESPVKGVPSITVNNRENCRMLLVACLGEIMVASISLVARLPGGESWAK